MIDYLSAVFLGLVQGLTEFLPISSSGHLVILHNVLPLELHDDLSFDVILHFGTLVALLIYFYKDIITYFSAFFKGLISSDLRNNECQKIAWFILIAALPAGLFGFLLEDKAESIFRSPILVGLMLILVGFLFLVIEKSSEKIKDIKEMGFFSALIIGFAQALALIPGVSRSGITILAGLTLKLKREAAAKFSFLLSIPVIFGAVIKRVADFIFQDVTSHELKIYTLGFAISFISGYLTIRFLLNYLRKHPLNIFAYYRFILGVGVILYFLFIR